MRIKWLDLALDDLIEIADYIGQDKPQAAKRMVARLWKAVRSLVANPERGRPGRVQGTRELIVADTPFIVPYRVKGTEIQILRVIHGARRWPEDL